MANRDSSRHILVTWYRGSQTTRAHASITVWTDTTLIATGTVGTEFTSRRDTRHQVRTIARSYNVPVKNITFQ